MSGLPKSGRRADLGRLSESAICVMAAVRLTDVTEYWNGLLRQSALMLAARITLPHFSVSAAISLPKSAGEPTSTVPPNSASRDLISGSARPALIALFRLSTISIGVLLGAPKPAQKLASKPGRTPLNVGVSGKTSD